MMLLSKQRKTLLAGVAAILCSGFFTTSVEAQNRREIVDRCKTATALVDLGSIGSGTAFCVHQDGLFVTNYHVVASVLEDDSVKLVLHPGSDKERVAEGRVVSLDAESDLALVQIEKVEGLTALPLAEPGSAFETMPITTFGYPFGRLLALAADVYPSISVNTARVGALRRVEGKVGAIQIDGTLNPGNSGGPVVDDEGRVVGVAVAAIPGANVSFAIPVGVLREFLDKPGLVLDVPEVRFIDRDRELELDVDVVLFREEAQPDAVRLDVFDSPQSKRTVEAERKGDGFRLKFPPMADVQSPQPLLLAVRHGEHTSYDRVSDASISIGSRTLQLAEVRAIESRPELDIITTVYGEKLAHEFKDWNNIRSDAGPVAELSKADRMDLFAIGDATPQIMWTLTALRGDKETATRSGVIRFAGFPVHVSPKPSTKFLELLADFEREFQQVERQLAEVKKDPDSLVRIEASRSTPPVWQTPEPTLIQSEGQATFTLQEDGSYFVEGNNPPTDTYELRYRLPFPLKTLTAIRLEILPDDRLPQKAISRGPSGNFVLHEIEFLAVPPGNGSGIDFDVLRATADFEQYLWNNQNALEFPVTGAVDGDPKTGWGLWQQMLQPHVAVFEVGMTDASEKGDSQVSDDSELRILLRQNYGKQESIGRFRVTVTKSPRPVLADRLPENVEAVLAVPSAERSDEQRQTLLDYFARTNIRLHQLERRLSELQFSRPMFPLSAITPMEDPYLLPPEELTIEAAVDGDSDLYVLRDGLIWDHLAWKKPGRENSMGKYVLINGEEWHPQWQNSPAVEGADQSEPYLLPLGPPTWDVEVVSVADLDGRPNPGRGSVTHHYEDGRLKLSFRDPGPEFGLFRVRLRRRNVDR